MSDQRTSQCAVHDKAEEFDPDHPDHLVCFECGHVYRSDAEIVAEYRNTYPGELIPPDGAESIGFCPLCLHDW